MFQLLELDFAPVCPRSKSRVVPRKGDKQQQQWHCDKLYCCEQDGNRGVDERLGSKAEPWRCHQGHEMPKKTHHECTEGDEEQSQPRIEGQFRLQGQVISTLFCQTATLSDALMENTERASDTA